MPSSAWAWRSVERTWPRRRGHGAHASHPRVLPPRTPAGIQHHSLGLSAPRTTPAHPAAHQPAARTGHHQPATHRGESLRAPPVARRTTRRRMATPTRPCHPPSASPCHSVAAYICYRRAFSKWKNISPYRADDALGATNRLFERVDIKHRKLDDAQIEHRYQQWLSDTKQFERTD